MNGDEARWADARTRLREPPSHEEVAQLRHRLRLSWWVITMLLVAALAAAFLTAGHPHARALAGPVIFGAGPVLVLVGVALSARSSSLRRDLVWPLSALAPHQRRLLWREVQGRAPAEPAHLDLARHLAHRQSLPTPSLPFAFGWLVLTITAGLLGPPSGVRIAVLAVAAAFFLGLLILSPVQGRRARRFLAEHPTPPDGSGGEP